MFKKFKNDPCWKKIIKLVFPFYLVGIATFWFLFAVLIVGLINNKETIDKSFYWGFIFCFQTVFISYSLSVFILNSNDEQQQKYRFLWLFLFLLAINPLGFISILLLMRQQKKHNNVIFEIQANTTFIKNEKWFLLWALYSSIASIIFIIPLPIAIINLIKIKSNWKSDLIEVEQLKKMAYFSSDITLIITNNFAF